MWNRIYYIVENENENSEAYFPFCEREFAILLYVFILISGQQNKKEKSVQG